MRRSLSPNSQYAANHAGIDEPCTIDARVIAEYLEQQRQPSMASFVRRLGGMLDAALDENRALVARVNAMTQPTPDPYYPKRFTGD